MSNKFTDEQLDLIAKNLLHDFALDGEKLNEIADSPTTWWKIKREINRQKFEQNNNWLAIWYRQIALFAAFAVLAVGFGIGVNRLLNAPNKEVVAKIENHIIETPKLVETVDSEKETVNNVSEFSTETGKTKVAAAQKIAAKTKTTVPKIIQNKTLEPKAERSIAAVKQLKTAPTQTKKVLEVNPASEEVKTEFISLSYLPTPESGQIVRVKVPRAMMVSLGVTNNVAKNSEMVNAEVILGDDGSSRAIRFISTNNK